MMTNGTSRELSTSSSRYGSPLTINHLDASGSQVSAQKMSVTFRRCAQYAERSLLKRCEIGKTLFDRPRPLQSLPGLQLATDCLVNRLAIGRHEKGLLALCRSSGCLTSEKSPRYLASVGRQMSSFAPRKHVLSRSERRLCRVPTTIHGEPVRFKATGQVRLRRRCHFRCSINDQEGRRWAPSGPVWISDSLSQTKSNDAEKSSRIVCSRTPGGPARFRRNNQRTRAGMRKLTDRFDKPGGIGVTHVVVAPAVEDQVERAQVRQVQHVRQQPAHADTGLARLGIGDPQSGRGHIDRRDVESLAGQDRWRSCPIRNLVRRSGTA
jgi:hypothetical protein